MKKNTLLMLLLATPLYFYSQVGIGTTNPAYDLDVAGNLNLNKNIGTGIALRVNSAEALWYNGNFFSWGYGGNYNYFKDRIAINTYNPQQALHIGGANSSIRIDGLNAANNVENDGLTPSYVKVNANGDLIAEQSPEFLISIDDFGDEVMITSNDGSGVSGTVYDTNFNMDTPGIVLIKYTLRVDDIELPNGNSIRDGAPRIIYSLLYVDGTRVNREGMFFSNDAGTGTTTASGPVYLSGQVYIQLGTGNHTVRLRGRVYGSDYGFRAEFGGDSSTNSLQILRF